MAEEQQGQLTPMMNVPAGGVPLAMSVGTLQAPSGGRVLMHFEHSTGSTVLTVTPEQAEEYGKALGEAAGHARKMLTVPIPKGIVVPGQNDK